MDMIIYYERNTSLHNHLDQMKNLLKGSEVEFRKKDQVRQIFISFLSGK